MNPIDLDPTRVRRLLVREVNWVGDAVLTLPALAALDRRFPRAEIAVLARGWVAELFRGQPGVDRVIEIRADGPHGGLAGRLRLARSLRAEGFDLALVLPNSFDAALVPWLARIPRRVGVARDGRGLLLTDRLPRRRGPAGRHQVEHYLDLVRSLGGEGDGIPRIEVRPEAREAARLLLAEVGLGEGRPLVAVNPGAIYGTAKQWGTARFAAVADGLVASRGVGVVLVGSAGERPLLEAVRDGMRSPAVVLGGRTDLATLAALLETCRLLLTNDTGAMHVAAAVGTPVAAVFGPTDPVATGPLGERVRIVRRPVPCSPCLLRECPIDQRCMTGVEVGEVLKAAEGLLGEKG